MFEEPEAFNKFTGNNPCICYTATPGGENISLEKKLIDYMGFRILEDQDCSPKNYEVKVVNDLIKYIDEHIT